MGLRADFPGADLMKKKAGTGERNCRKAEEEIYRGADRGWRGLPGR